MSEQKITKTVTEIEVVKSELGISLIKVSADAYCVEKFKRGWFGRKTTYFLTKFNGLHLEVKHPCIADLERCELIYNANVLLERGR